MSENILPTKKELKRMINENGAFTQMDINVTSTESDSKDSVNFKGIASNSDKNRNGYIIEAAAWNAALAEYMNNPVILLQHDMDKPIGKATGARVVNNQLEVEGVLYKSQMNSESWEALQNGVLKGLSTGHITKASAFVNEETGQRVDEEDVGKAGQPTWAEIVFNEAWTMVVTALEWLEFSLVTIPANRKSMITETNALEASKDAKLNAAEKNGAQIDEDKWNEEANETPEVDETTEEVEETTETPEPEATEEAEEEVETADENAAPEEEAENADESEDTAPEEETEETVEETDAPEAEEKPEAEPEAPQPETSSVDLREMTMHLAKNLSQTEEAVEEMKSVDFNAMLNEANEKNETRVNELGNQIDAKLNTLGQTIETLAAKLNEIDDALSKVVVNRPRINSTQSKKTPTKKDRWA